jgi:hypothetical protein
MRIGVRLAGDAFAGSRGHEAGAGIEPANRGFADLGLTTWLPRQRENWQHRLEFSRVNLQLRETSVENE